MKKKKKWKQILRDMRLNIAVFVILLALIIFGRQIIRISLLENAQETGTALTRSYAAEERGNLEVYENLLAFGVATLDDLIDQGYTRPELMAWMERYFNRLQYILGEDVVTPYLILDGEVISVSGPVSVSGYDYTDSVWYEKNAGGGWADHFYRYVPGCGQRGAGGDRLQKVQKLREYAGF